MPKSIFRHSTFYLIIIYSLQSYDDVGIVRYHGVCQKTNLGRGTPIDPPFAVDHYVYGIAVDDSTIFLQCKFSAYFEPLLPPKTAAATVRAGHLREEINGLALRFDTFYFLFLFNFAKFEPN